MSALPPKADMCSATRDVRYVPIADIDCLASHAAKVGQTVNRRQPVRHGQGPRPSAKCLVRCNASKGWSLWRATHSARLRGRCHHQGWDSLGDGLCIPGQSAGPMRTTAAIHVASSSPIARTMIVLNFTGVSRAAPLRANIAVWPLIPGALRQENGRIEKKDNNGDHHSSHREKESAGHQFDPHSAMLAGSAGT